MNSSRVFHGIDAMIADTCSLALMVEGVGQGSEMWKKSLIRLVDVK